MSSGRIVQYGTYQELLERGVDFHAELGDGLQTPQQLSPAPSLTPATSMPGPGAVNELSTCVTQLPVMLDCCHTLSPGCKATGKGGASVRVLPHAGSW